MSKANDGDGMSIVVDCPDCGKEILGFIKDDVLYLAAEDKTNSPKKEKTKMQKAADKAWITMHEREKNMSPKELKALKQKRINAGKKAAETRKRNKAKRNKGK